jgi:hypothetical protein
LLESQQCNSSEEVRVVAKKTGGKSGSKNGGEKGKHRSAITGKYVSAKYGKSHPKTTVKEK